MNAFFKKRLASPPQRIGHRLKELREQQNITLETLSQKTRISQRYLQALEDCRFKDLKMSAVYQKNLVRNYVQTLGLESEPFVKQYIIEEMLDSKKARHPHKIIKFNPLNFLPSIIRYGLVVLIALGLVGYLVWQIKNILEPPRLLIYAPPEGYITAEERLLIKGETNKEVVLTINGQGIAHDEKGQFAEIIDLSPGVNNITLTARKKHGKTTTEVRHVVLKAD